MRRRPAIEGNMKTCAVFSKRLKLAKSNDQPVVDSEGDDVEVSAVRFVSGDVGRRGGAASIILH
jgi:hypothetical protein